MRSLKRRFGKEDAIVGDDADLLAVYASETYSRYGLATMVSYI